MRDELGTVIAAVAAGLNDALPGVDVREDVDLRWRSEEQAPKVADYPRVVVSGSANYPPEDRYAGMVEVSLEIELESWILDEESIEPHHAHRKAILDYIKSDDGLYADSGARDMSSLTLTIGPGEITTATFSVTIYV